MKLTLSNFQIHKAPTTIDIPEGETTYLEGDSDTGKSSRLRALRWLCENKPDGGSFVTFKQPRGTTSTVTLELDGHTVERERGKSKNTYRMDGETFEAFGRAVPEPVTKFLNLSPYAFQLQGETPFLIGANPTDAAKILSEACGLGVIDTAVGFIRGKKAAAEAEIRKSEILLESGQRRLDDAASQLPLAGALETAAGFGEEAAALTERSMCLSNAICEEPSGEVLDVGRARQNAAAARSALGEVQALLAMIASLRRAVGAEPTGMLRDVEAVRPVVAIARSRNDECRALANRVTVLQRALSDEPFGETYDLEAVRAAVARSRQLEGERRAIGELTNSRLRPAVCSEPGGELRNTADVAVAIAKARATQAEREMLGKMCSAMAAALRSEPQGNLIDTTELKQQRAQIKVCPTCGREM